MRIKNYIENINCRTLINNRECIKNRARLRESQDIALKVLAKLDDLSWSQIRLDEE